MVPLAVISLKNVRFEYPGRHLALDDVSLEVAEGERVALIGPNGAGKSTLLHLMAALDFPQAGEVIVAGRKVERKGAAETRKQVGFLFQDPDDQVFMPSVWEDVAFGPLNMGLPEEEVRHRVEKALEESGASHLSKRVPQNLSLGEKKRVAVAGLLSMSPPVLLLDEPTANLDPQGRRDLLNILSGLKQSMVIATHDLALAFELADRAVVLNKKVLFDGSIHELVKMPEVLKEANLELPSFSRLMMMYRQHVGADFEPPLTVEEAFELLKDHRS
ncbi:MAG TPA: ABC transporter ATP-binding protein [Methanomassiliicoccales archaeon]|nr:ABC transporter ATP-binding protein [Methanomassiliicoccales archaeon]